MAANQRHHRITETIRAALTMIRRARALDVALDQIAVLPGHLREDILRQPPGMVHNFRSITSNTFVCVIASSGACFPS